MLYDVRFRDLYPRVTWYLQTRLPVVISHPDVLAAFTKWTYISEEEAKKLAGGGTSPWLKASDTGSDGYFDPANPDCIFLSSRICKLMEENFHYLNKQEYFSKLHATVLHELVHWVRHRTPVTHLMEQLEDIDDRFGHAADSFEQEAFGWIKYFHEDDFSTAYFEKTPGDLNTNQSWPAR